MDKFDLELFAQKSKNKINVTRTLINRKLEDLSFSTVFGKQMAIHCGAAVLCIVLLCVILSSIVNLNCRNDMNELITNTAMEIVNVKNQDMTISQDIAHINKHMITASITANDNGFIDNSVCVLYNTTTQSVEKYTAICIQNKSDRLAEWYQEGTGNLNAEPIFALPDTLRLFAKEHQNKTLVITSVRLANNVLTPEVVEARSGRKIVAEWSETEGLDPNRMIITGEFPIIIAGVEAEDEILNVITSHSFEGDVKNNAVTYDKSQWPNNIRIATKQFSANGANYEVSLIYEYAGLRPVSWFIVFASIVILGVAIITSLVQTKKIREF